MAELATPARWRLRVFTHPACGGCSEAVKEAWRLSQERPGLEMLTVSLERPEGLQEARAEGVRTIPTVILGSAEGEMRRWVGTPEPGALEAALEELLRPA